MTKAIIGTCALILVFVCTATAQSLTKAKLIGKWKATAMEVVGKQLALTSAASITQDFMKLAAAERKLKQEDSATFRQMGELIYGMVGDIRFDFRADNTMIGTIGISIDGKKKTETDTMRYTLAGDKLTMSSTKNKKEKGETVEVQMPDARTVIMTNLAVARGGKVTFTKQ